MRHEEIARLLIQLNDEAGASHPSWWADETFDALLRSTTEADVPIYVSYEKLFLYAAFAPLSQLEGDVASDLIEWRFSVPSRTGWHRCYDGKRTWGSLCPGIADAGTQRLEGATPLLFLRSSATHDDSFIEPNQLLTHTLDLHKGDSDDWVRCNELGELEPILRTSKGEGTLVTLNRDALDEYLALSSSALVRVFEFKRWTGEVGLRSSSSEQVCKPDEALFYRLEQSLMNGRRFVLMRGVNILRADQANTLQRLNRRGPTKSESFLIWDWKNQKDIEWPADESKLGNYFGKPGPYGTCPAFFKPELLLAFRAEPHRFIVEPDRIICRGAWSIPYYVNEAGQVHAYIKDLASLPHQEQLRWKAHNQPRKGGISKKAYIQDFKGEFCDDYDPLESLLEIASEFPTIGHDKGRLELWRTGSDLAQLGYVLTESPKEFQDQVLCLTKVVVEGLVAKTINTMSKRLNCRDDKLGSIKQLDRLMETLGVSKDDRDVVTSPLSEVQGLRSSVAAHRGKALIDTPQKRFFELLSTCDTALRKLAELVRQGVFTRSVQE